MRSGISRVNAGPSGAGHFTKLVHNGIEFGLHFVPVTALSTFLSDE